MWSFPTMILPNSRLISYLRSIWISRIVSSRLNCSKISCFCRLSPRSKLHQLNSRLESHSFRTPSPKSSSTRKMCTLTNWWCLRPLEATKVRSRLGPPNSTFISLQSATLLLVPNRWCSNSQCHLRGSRLSRCSNRSSLKAKDLCKWRCILPTKRTSLMTIRTTWVIEMIKVPSSHKATFSSPLFTLRCPLLTTRWLVDRNVTSLQMPRALAPLELVHLSC